MSDPNRIIPAIETGKFLVRKGFIPASDEGKEKRLLSESCQLGIMWRDPDAEPRKYLFGLIRKPPKGELLAIVHFRNESLMATENKWVLEIYGRKYLTWGKRIADDLAAAFGVEVSPRFISEDAIIEK
jgi:hypothetical protein